MRFKDKVCVITGGANGIGACMVKEFAQAGASTVFIDTDKTEGERMLENVLKSGGKGLFYHGDISIEGTLDSFADTVINKYGKIDILINMVLLQERISLSTAA